MQIAREVRAHFFAREKMRLTMKDIDVPPLPPDAIDYLRMRLRDLTPNDYWATSRYDMEVGLAVQDARDMGIVDARETYDSKE